MPKRDLAHLSFPTDSGSALRQLSSETAELGKVLEDARRDHREGRALTGKAARDFLQATREKAFAAYPAISETD